jgi:hypothetical protein
MRVWMRWVVGLGLFSVVLAVSGAGADAREQRRLALVIANGTHAEARALTKARADAEAMRAGLEKSGFEVRMHVDLDAAGMRDRLRALGSEITSADVVLFYFSGHAVTYDGRSWLLATDSKLESAATLRASAVDVEWAVREIRSLIGANVVLLDASRERPAPTSRGVVEAARPIGRLEVGSETLVAYAAEAGGRVADGSGGVSPFTAALARHITQPGAPLHEALDRVVADVRAETGGRQVPYYTSSLTRAVDLARPELQPAGTLPASARVPPAIRSCEDLLLEARTGGDRIGSLRRFRSACPGHPRTAEVARMLERALDNRACERALAAPSIATLKDYLDDHPSGSCARAVQEKLAHLMNEQPAAAQASPPATSRPLKGEQRPTTAVLTRPAAVATDRPATAAPSSPANVSVSSTAAPAAASAPAVASESDPAQLARAVQKELQRLGCYSAGIDGDWGSGSRSALARFDAITKAGLATREPTADVLARVRRQQGTVCVSCGAGELLVDGACVARPKPRKPAVASRRESAPVQVPVVKEVERKPRPAAVHIERRKRPVAPVVERRKPQRAEPATVRRTGGESRPGRGGTCTSWMFHGTSCTDGRGRYCRQEPGGRRCS